MIINGETAKEIPGYPGYFATKSGTIYSNRKQYIKALKEQINPWGHRYVYVSKSGWLRSKRTQVHRLVAYTFLDNPLNKPVINHLDSNPSNNNVSNLEWATNHENVLHAARNGRMGKAKGEKNFKAKLTDKQVRSIREEYSTGVTQKYLGSKFGVGQGTISRIVINKSWRHI